MSSSTGGNIKVRDDEYPPKKKVRRKRGPKSGKWSQKDKGDIINDENKSDGIFNLSHKELIAAHKSVMNKGLKFAPTERN